VPRPLVWALALAGGALWLRGRPRGGGAVPAGDVLEVWTLGQKLGQRCGVPLSPAVTGDFGDVVHEQLQLPPGVRGWGWTPPGDLRAAQRFGPQLVADLEDRKSTKAKPSAGWTGDEVAEAEALAELAGGITSHGYVFKNLRPVLAPFAARGRRVYPQVYDSDRSTEPRKFLRTCVTMWRDAGFVDVVPLLGVSAGADWLRAWLEECAVLGVPAALYSLERMEQLEIPCP
jgi:hypothetical protein